MKGKEVATYGAVLSILCMIYFVVTNLLGVSGTEVAGWSGYAPYLVVLVIGFLRHDPPLDNYGKRFLFGISITGLAAIASSVFMYLYLILIDDLMVRTVVDNKIAALDRHAPDFSLQAEGIRQTITPLLYLKFGTIVGLIIGTILTTITALFVKPRLAAAAHK